MQLPPVLRALLDRPEPARRLGRFALVRQLGRGGFAPVWLARESYGDVELRWVAIKLFAFDALEPSAGTGGAGGAGGAPDDPRRARVIEEARLLCKVEHVNIVRFHQLLVDEEPGVLGLVMEHIDGPSLEERLRRERRLPIDEVLAIGASVASALSAVHRAGLVHRDVKPANLVEAHGVIKLIDFGVALLRRGSGERGARGRQRLTLPDLGPEALGAAMSTLASSMASGGTTPEVDELPGGTVGYIDPVCVAEGAPAAPASDLYALGATLYQCLTGLLPSMAAAGPEGGLKGEVLDGRAAAPPVADLAPEAPVELCRLVDALLVPAREARPASAEQVAATLEQLQAARSGPGAAARLGSARGPEVSEASMLEARRRYFEYLAAECSEIQLDGLPADQEVGARRLRLERLFVPLKLSKAAPMEAADAGREEPRYGVGHLPAAESADDHAGGTVSLHLAELSEPRLPRGEPVRLGQVLAEHPRLAVVGLPGAGKSTMLRSLAIAYAFPERRSLLDAALPERPWLPILIRCRELGELVVKPITTIVSSIPGWTLMDVQHEPGFAALVRRALTSGEVLLLIDGLDEIADDGRRTIFVRNLRTFLAMHPRVSTVVTSREAGFRIVAGALAAECRVMTIDDFDAEDIRRLTVAWYREVLGDRPSVITDARSLADTIIANNRIFLLARNPLLLMTLLLVNRWLGQLPTKRVALYDKAIEVLLMSWNVEAHGKLDPEEVIPQLAFVAFSMVQQGMQRITAPELRRLLQEAREQMPEILAYARLGVGDLIERVEYRSSLLVQAGKQLVDGRLWELYEFRHLTFQEHLAALAAVKRYHPEQADTGDLVSLLRPYFRDAHWREIIPLAAVLAGRDAKPLVEALAIECEQAPPDAEGAWVELARLLWQCLVDAVQIPPPLVDRALYALLRAAPHRINWAPLARGRYGEALWGALGRVFREPPHAFSLAFPLAAVTGERLGISTETPASELHAALLPLLESADPVERAAAAASMAWLPLVQGTEDANEYTWRMRSLRWKGSVAPLLRRVVPLIEAELPGLQYAACEALGRLSWDRPGSLGGVADALPRLGHLWAFSPWDDVRRVAGTAIWIMVLHEQPRAPQAEVEAELLAAIRSAAEEKDVEPRLVAATLAYFHGAPWPDEELVKRLIPLRRQLSRFFVNQLDVMLESLLPDGTPVHDDDAGG